jgi:hypothetical protein
MAWYSTVAACILFIALTDERTQEDFEFSLCWQHDRMMLIWNDERGGIGKFKFVFLCFNK